MGTVKEQALLLGPRKSLVGVVSSAAAANEPGRPLVLILNSGIIHRVGTNRMSVALARRLAADGHDVVRFDLSGIGDSEPRVDGLPPLEAALADIREAIDSLEAARGAHRVVLMGLCSGADFSILHAASDPRVVGVVLMDPTIPRTTRYYLHHYLSRLTRIRPWINVFLGRHPLWKRLLRRLDVRRRPAETAGGQVAADAPVVDDLTVRAFFERAYVGAVANSVQIQAIFTAGVEDQHNYRNQMIDAFPSVPFGAQLALEYFDDSDHMFTSEAARERLIDLVQAWCRRTAFPSRESPRNDPALASS